MTALDVLEELVNACTPPGGEINPVWHPVVRDECRRRRGEGMKRVPWSLNEIRFKVAEARRAALREAKKDWEYRCFFPRGGVTLATADKDGQCWPSPAAECHPWNGTKRQIEELVEQVLREYPKVTSIYLEGGYDGADSPKARRDGDYQPQCAMWEVTLWERRPAPEAA